VDVHAKLAEIRADVAEARGMPMSASCVVNRTELLAALDQLAEMLPQAFGESDRVIAERDDVIERAQAEAREILAGAEQRQGRLVSDSDVFALSRHEAQQTVDEAKAEADDLRREADDYVDEKLAHFELVLTETLQKLHRGRNRLRDRSNLNFGGSVVDEIKLPDTSG